MRLLLLACAGGAIGSGARHLVNIGAARLLGAGFPYGTLTVNIAGAFMMGLIIEMLALRLAGSIELRTLLATGFLGGFTTFSAFSLDTVQLIQRGETITALGYIALSVGGSLAAIVLGLTLTRIVLQ